MKKVFLIIVTGMIVVGCSITLLIKSNDAKINVKQEADLDSVNVKPNIIRIPKGKQPP